MLMIDVVLFYTIVKIGVLDFSSRQFKTSSVCLPVCLCLWLRLCVCVLEVVIYGGELFRNAL